MKNVILKGFGAFLFLAVAHTSAQPKEFELVLGTPIKNANLSEQCPRYKVSNKPALLPRFKCRFS